MLGSLLLWKNEVKNIILSLLIRIRVYLGIGFMDLVVQTKISGSTLWNLPPLFLSSRFGQFSGVAIIRAVNVLLHRQPCSFAPIPHKSLPALLVYVATLVVGGTITDFRN